jgi:hypothetical protein
MNWYVIDVIDRAMERTRACLFEPFNFTKWLKLALIVFFIGGSGGFNGGGNGSSYDSSGGEPDLSWLPDGLAHLLSGIYDHISAYSGLTLIIGFLLFIFVFVIIMALISSIMEFVLVESLVSNSVRVREYFKKFIGKGLSLFALRFLLMFAVILIIALVSVPFIFLIAESDSGPAGLLGIIGLIFVIIAVVLVLIIVLGIVGSFINMAIPVSLYQNSGIFSALGSVFGQFKADWKQLVIYWIGRGILGFTVVIIAGILSFIILIILLLVFGVIDFALYLILDMILSEMLLWSLLIAIALVEILFLMFASAIVRTPFSIFMKYHMLSFLELWYPLKIPMFDEQHSVSGNSSGQLSEESVVSEE